MEIFLSEIDVLENQLLKSITNQQKAHETFEKKQHTNKC